MFWTIFTILNGVFILVLLYSNRTRRKNEPPLDKGLIPWLGHALEFGKDAASFLSRMKEKHGDIFTVRVAGMYLTVLLDPHSFDTVLNDSVSLDLSHKKNKLLEHIFSLQLPGVKATDERRLMEEHFHGAGVSQLCNSMNTHMEKLLLNDYKNHKDWRQEGLFSLCYSWLFRAGYLTLFEKTGNVSAVYKEFRNFDDHLAKLARNSLRRDEKKIVTSARERLWELLSPKCLSSESNPWQRDYLDFLQKEGVGVEMQKRALLLQLWTTQCNVGPAAFWLLGFLLTHPEAMEAVRSEIRSLTLQDSSLEHAPIKSLKAQRTPVLDSVLSETLRLTAAVMISRDVVQDKTVHMANGQEYFLRKGDKVCLFPFLSPQMDRDIHPEPQMFVYDRFLDDDKRVKSTFYKHGKMLKYYTMPWGAGGNMCVGKEFAVLAIKQFVFLVLTHLDMELCEQEAKLPPVNPSRYGFGMLQPDGDLQVRYRPKRIQHKL